MSVPVIRTSLRSEEKLKINTDLTLQIEKGSGKHQKVELLQCYITNPIVINLPLYYAANVLDYTNDNINHFRKDIDFKGILRSHQERIISEGLEKLAQERTFTLIASTGSGKTVIGVWFSCKLRSITCILIDRENLIKQWKDTIIKFTSGNFWVVGEKDPESLPEFIICMNLRTHKIPENIRKEVSLLIIDEAHKFCTKKNFERIMLFNPIYVISMTATPNRKDRAFEIINNISGNEYIKYSSDKPIQVVRINTPFTWSRIINEKTGELDWSIIDKEIHLHSERNAMLLTLVMSNLDRKIMIFSGRKQHVDMLYNTFKYYNVKCDYMSGNKKSYSDSNVLIGTTSKIGTGFDEATFCPDFSGNHIDMIIIFNSYKSLIQLEQNIGRSRADFPTIYHFVDKDSLIYKHWLELRKFYLNPDSAVKAEIYITNITADKIWPYDQEGNWIL